jgi:putative glycosyltransferase (TIGR04348 family)
MGLNLFFHRYRMRIVIVTPVPARSRKGNRITAMRWKRMLEALGHRVKVVQEWNGQRCDLFIALHARKSHRSTASFRRQRPDVPVFVTLTGTDVYDEIHTSPEAQASLELADRLIVLQPLAIRELPSHLRPKARVVFQSCEPLPHPQRRSKIVFDVCVIGHLRPVKDPFRTAEASRLLPATSFVRVLHLGAALGLEMAQQARREMKENPRYRWLGDVSRERALGLLARSHLLVLSSVLEGGANVISEAIALGTPVLASRIPGSVGLLGADYPGYFPVGDTAALTRLIRRAETDESFYQRLIAWCRRLRNRFTPVQERETWRSLIAEFLPHQRHARA